jgi:hypothetical protein
MFNVLLCMQYAKCLQAILGLSVYPGVSTCLKTRRKGDITERICTSMAAIIH